MYNYSFYCSYLDASKNQHNQDTTYRHEILKAFNLMVYDHEKMMNTISELYNKYMENPQVQEILKILKENNKYSFLFDTFQDLFTLLFSFEYFYYFHTCIAELEQSNSISDIIYEKFIKVLKNNNNN
tara:strand:+ start:5238 stop:5618 length:381 start_codon:yes stop_codon:yes gene_type:complete